MADKVTDEAYVTLVTTAKYGLGAFVLAHSLRDTGTTRQLVCMITDQIGYEIRNLLLSVFDEVEVVQELNSYDQEHLTLLGRPELGPTFTKLACWTLTQYHKAVFLDADTLCLRNIDDLFDREEFSAAPDVGWPDCFNSGVFVFRPSLDTFHNLVTLAETQGSFDGGDQGLLNMFFSDWATGDIKRHLPFIYNLNTNATYFYAPAYNKYGHLTRLVHFIGPIKPWDCHQDGRGGECTRASEDVRHWWNVVRRHLPNNDLSIFNLGKVCPGSGHCPLSTTGTGHLSMNEIEAHLDYMIGGWTTIYENPDCPQMLLNDQVCLVQGHPPRMPSMGPGEGEQVAHMLLNENQWGAEAVVRKYRPFSTYTSDQSKQPSPRRQHHTKNHHVHFEVDQMKP